MKQTFLTDLEARLASLTGRDRWPSIEARTTSSQVPADPVSYQGFITFLPFSWTVKGKPYVTLLRASNVRPVALLTERHATILQYNPTNPARSYYAPQQYLARAAFAIVVVLLGVALTVLAVLLGIR